MTMKRNNKRSNTIHTTIDELSITISTSNIHIEDSYKVISPLYMKYVLSDIIEFLNSNHITMDTPFNHRSICSMVNEWKTHNNLYKLNIEPERTKDCDLNYPQKWYMPIIYFFGGLVVI